MIPKGAALFFLVGLVAAGILGIYLSQIASEVPVLVYETGPSLAVIPDKINYKIGEPMHIRIINSGTTTLFFADSSYGLKVLRLDGTIIYSPLSVQVISKLEPKEEKDFLWDQTKNDGSKTYQGRYKIISNTYAESENVIKSSVIVNILK